MELPGGPESDEHDGGIQRWEPRQTICVAMAANTSASQPPPVPDHHVQADPQFHGLPPLNWCPHKKVCGRAAFCPATSTAKLELQLQYYY